MPANYLCVSDTWLIHTTPSCPLKGSMSRDTPHLGSEVRVDYVSIMSFTISRRAHWLRSPEPCRLIEVASQHLEVNVGVFACASVGSSEWFTYKISPGGHGGRWQARISLGKKKKKNQSLPVIHRLQRIIVAIKRNSLIRCSVVRRCVWLFAGQCLCGQCTCHPPGDSRIHGKNCECDDRQCEDISGEVCGGKSTRAHTYAHQHSHNHSLFLIRHCRQ